MNPEVDLNALLAVNILVSFFVLLVGVAALVSGLRRKYPKYCIETNAELYSRWRNN